jgi:hypothetical protein
MKKIVTSMLVLAALAGCGRNLEISAPETVTVSISATAVAPAVKGTLSQDQYFCWSPGDRILVQLTDGSYAVFETKEGGVSASFTGTIPSNTQPGQSAYYPAGAVNAGADGVSFKIGPVISSGLSEVLIPMAGRRWGNEPFSFRAVTGAVKLMVENVPDEFGDKGSLVFQATEATSGSYPYDPAKGALTWDAAKYASRGSFSDGSKISVDVEVTRGRAVTAYIPLPENSNWGKVRISLHDKNGKSYLQREIPEGTLVPVETGRITRLPALQFPSDIAKALDPTDGDFSFWDSIPDLTESATFTPWTWRSSWKGEDVYSTEDFNIVCKHIKFYSDAKYLYGYLYLDTTIPHNLNESLQHFYVMIDNDNTTEGQSFGGNNIAEVPRYRGYNVMLYGTACTDGVPKPWHPALYNCTVDAGASNTNINGSVVSGVADAGYGGGSFDGDILRWEFIIDRGKTELTGRTHTNVCVAFCSGTNSPYLIMPSIHGFELDLQNE